MSIINNCCNVHAFYYDLNVEDLMQKNYII